MLSIEQLRIWAKEFGFCEVGLCSADGFLHSQMIVESQEPLSERRQLRFHPKADYPDIKSIAVLLWPYHPAKSEKKSNVFVDRYYHASNAAYHAALELESRMLSAGCFAKANVSYPAKEAALRSGMGIIGKNSLLITPQHGSRVVIILMATGIEIQSAPEHECNCQSASCMNCGRCAKACPAGAIDQNGLTHPEHCLRNFIMEGVVVPEHLRKRIGMKLIGCDTCQRVCPMQPILDENDEAEGYALRDFMTEDPDVFSSSVAKLAKEIGRNTARAQRIRAQAALLAGNSGDAEYLPVLRAWAKSPFEAVRQHAKWAVSEIELANENT